MDKRIQNLTRYEYCGDVEDTMANVVIPFFEASKLSKLKDRVHLMNMNMDTHVLLFFQAVRDTVAILLLSTTLFQYKIDNEFGNGSGLEISWMDQWK